MNPVYNEGGDGGGIQAVLGPGGLQVTDSRPKDIWGRIVTQVSTNLYTFTQIAETDASTFATDGSTFAITGRCYEITGRTDVPADASTGAKVRLFLSAAGTYYLFTYASGGGVTAEEVDGSPSYTSVTTLRFDQVDGFVLTQPGAGIARVDLQAASSAQAGIVVLTTQTWAGTKVVIASTITAGQAVTAGMSAVGVPVQVDTLGTQTGTFATEPPGPNAASLYVGGCYISSRTPEISQGTNGHGFDLWLMPGIFQSDAESPAYGGMVVATGPYAYWDVDTGNLSSGITGTRTVKDGAGSNKTVTISGGIITDWQT